MTGSSVSYQLCQWDSGDKVIGKIQYFIIYNVKICVKHFGNFHTSRTLVEYKQTMASPDKDCLSKVKTRMIRTVKVRRINMGKQMFGVAVVGLMGAAIDMALRGGTEIMG